MHDTYEAMVETASPIVSDASAGGDALAGLRAALRAGGATLLGAGLHPAAAFGDVVHVPQERYRHVADTVRGLLARTPTAALHVHVGMPDPETAILVCNRLRGFLPVLQGLAAHSPFWHGRDAGFATARAQMFRGYPNAVIPRAFAGWEDYATTVDAVVAAGESARLQLPVVGRPAPSGARDGRAARHGRPGAAGLGARPRRARARAGAGLRRGRRPAAPRGAADRGHRPVVLQRRPRRPGRPAVVARGAAAAARGRRGGARRSPARTRARSAPTARSRRSSGSCARATGRTGCGPRSAEVACGRCWSCSPRRRQPRSKGCETSVSVPLRPTGTT